MVVFIYNACRGEFTDECGTGLTNRNRFDKITGVKIKKGVMK